MTGQILDRAVIEELQETMGEDFAEELITTFLQEAPGMLADLEAAEKAGDAEAFRRAAHSIKSNAATFGANQLADAARVLELEGPQPDGVANLNRMFQDAETHLKGMLNGG